MGPGAFCWPLLGSVIAEEDNQPIVARSDIAVSFAVTTLDSWMLKT
jgi:hypothetical protein